MAAALATPCQADDDAFLNVDPPTILSPGDGLFLQWLGWSNGHTGETFNGFQAVSEFDFAVSERLQIALSIEYDWQRSRAPFERGETDSYPSLGLEALYVVIPAEEGHFGLSLAIDPWISLDDRGFEMRALLQQNIFGFQNVLNIGLTNAWERDAGDWTETSGISLNYGIAFPVNSHWTISFEANNDRGFDGLFPSSGLRQSASTYYAGPTIQYDCEVAVVTLGAQAQLPLSGTNKGADGFTPDAERFRVLFRVARQI